MSLHTCKRIKANTSTAVLEKDKQEAEPIEELNETLHRLENQKHELEKKVCAKIRKAQLLNATLKGPGSMDALSSHDLRSALMKCTEKKGRLQKKLDKLRSFSFSIENQITLLKGHANMGKTSAYDDSPLNEGSAMKSKDSMDMTMNNDELREMIDEINKDLKYMQLKSSEKLWRRCRHVLNKPLVSMKNNLSKLFQGDRKPVTRSRKPGNGAFRLNVNGFKSDGGLIGVGQWEE